MPANLMHPQHRWRLPALLVALALLGGCTGSGPDRSNEATARSTPSATHAVASETSPAPGIESPTPLPDGTTAEPGDWELIAITPDERHLLVALSRPGCGVTMHRLDVTETATSVAIAAIAAVPTGTAKCGGLGNLLLGEAALEQPLGDRSLVGCRADDAESDCREPAVDRADVSAIELAGTAVFEDIAVLSRDGLHAFAIEDGAPRWHREDLQDASPMGRWGDVVIARRGDGSVLGLEEAYGPHTTYVGDDIVVVPHRADFTILHGIDPRTGDLAWTYEAAGASEITAIVMTGSDPMLVHARGPDHSTGFVATVDQASGGELARWAVPAGALVDVSSERVVFDLADDRLALYTLAGEQLAEYRHPPGLVQAVVSGSALVSSGQGWAAVDLATGDTGWSSGLDHGRWTIRDPLGLLVVDGRHLVALDAATGVERLRVDPLDVALDASAEAVTTIATPNAVLGITADGTVAWWQHAPPDTTQP